MGTQKIADLICTPTSGSALAEDCVPLLADGRVRVELKRVWRDGTTHLLFEPVEFLEKLAALMPRPEITLALYHGVLGPHAHERSCSP